MTTTSSTPIEMTRGRITGPFQRHRAAAPMTITSMNVNGILSDTTKQTAVRGLITGNDIVRPSCIVMLQEIKKSHDRDLGLTNEEKQGLADCTNPGGRSWLTAYCGINLSPRMEQHEAHAESMLAGRVIVLHMLGVRFVDIYAPQRHERKIFYNNLAALLQPGPDLLIVGDWNVVPNPMHIFDWLHGNVQNRNTGGVEKDALLESLHPNGLLEPKQALDVDRGAADYTHISPLQHGQRRFRRLDWFAVSPEILTRVDPTSLTTSPLWLTGGDHAAISVRLNEAPNTPQPALPTPQRRTLQPALLAQGDFYDIVRERVELTNAATAHADDEDLLAAVDSLLDDILQLGISHCAALRKQHQRITKQAIDALKTLYTTFPDPATWGDDFHAKRISANEKIAALIEQDSRHTAEAADIDFNYSGRQDDELFKYIGADQLPTTFTSQKICLPPKDDEQSIDSIRDPALRAELAAGPGWEPPPSQPDYTAVHDDGTGYTSTHDGMLANTRNFYMALLRRRRIHRGCRNRVLRCFPKNRFSAAVVRMLGADATESEVLLALRSLKDNKACGPDGIPAEVYKELATVWASLLTRLYNACFRIGHGNIHMIEALLSLLRKKGDPRDLNNIRALSLVNKVCSALAGLFKRRLKPQLPHATLPDQCSYTPGRYMWESIFRVMDGIEWAKYKHLPMAMLLADARKAFDLIDSGFIREAMILLCGGDLNDPQVEVNLDGELTDVGRVLRWIDILLGAPDHPLSRRVLLNGVFTDVFNPRSGCPQGLEISAQIYNIANDALMGLLQDAGVQGIMLHPAHRSDTTPPPQPMTPVPGMPILQPVGFFASRFADDFVALVLLCWLHTVLDALDVHCAGTTQATNFSKTTAFGIGAYAADSAPWDPAGRVKWLPPGQAAGVALGVPVGPDADPASNWAKIAASMFGHLRRWQMYRLTYRGNTRALSTYVWSRCWFLSAFRPPPAKLVLTCTAASRQFIWKGSIPLDSTPLSSPKTFPPGTRHAQDRLHNPVELGGQQWTSPQICIDAIHIMWLVELLRPRRHNMHPTQLMAAFDMAYDNIATRFNIAVAIDGNVATQTAEALLLSAAFQKPLQLHRQMVPDNWWTYLKAWVRLRPSLQVQAPNTYEQVMAVPLWHHTGVMHGVSNTDRNRLCRCGITHVRHIWGATNSPGCDRPLQSLAHTELLRSLLNAIPENWVRLLKAGPTDFQAGHWVLVHSDQLDAPKIDGIGMLAKVQSRPAPHLCIVDTYAPAACGGWRPDGIRAVPTATLQHATVEPAAGSPDGGPPLTWLAGPTALVYYASRVCVTHSASRTLSTLKQTHIRKLLTGPALMPPKAVQLLTALKASGEVSLPAVFITINGAPWPTKAKNFAYDLAADAMPTGMGIYNVSTTGCLYCSGRVNGPTPRDSVQHMLESCPYLEPLRSLLDEIGTALRLTTNMPKFATFLAYGLTAATTDKAVAIATRGALLTATRWTRNMIIAEGHTPSTPAAMRKMTIKHLRHHIRLEWHAATVAMNVRTKLVYSKAAPDVHRPANINAFRKRWGCLCHPNDGCLQFIGPLSLQQ